jgi:tetratricopeptide (TPR) repeat protein
MVQKEKGQFDLARASLEKCLQLDPEHAGARLQLGLLQRDVFGDDLMARRLFQEASQIPGTASEIVSAAKAYLAEMDAKSGYFSFKVQQ